MSDRPVLGVALSVAELEEHIALVRETERDVELQDFISAAVLASDWRPLVDRARALLDGHGGRLGTHGPFWSFTLDATDPDVTELIHRRLDEALNVADALGATHMVIHSPVSIWSHHNFDTWPGAHDRLMEAFRVNVGPAVARAADIGCTLMVENVEDCDPDARGVLARQFASGAIKVSLDTGHANYAHSMHGAPPVDVYVRTAGRELGHVHIQDSDGYADRHWPPGEGNIAWRAVFAALNEATSLDNGDDEPPRLIVELRRKSELRQAIDHLEGLGLAR